MLDIFKTDAFSMVSLTLAINKLPHVPGRIGSMGLFTKRGITTHTAVVEEQQGRLALIPTAARGTHPNVWSRKGRNVRSFEVPYVPLDTAVMAEDVQGVRAFGSENALEGVTQVVNDKLGDLKQNHEATWEFFRVKAIQGNLVDADGSTLFNWFTEFGITEKVIDFDLDSTDTNVVKLKAMEARRHIETQLGGTTFRGIHAICGDNFFDELVTQAGVKEAYDRFQDSAFFRNVQRGPNGEGGGFEFAGIMWENYRGSVGGTSFVPTEECRIFPTGVPNVFQEIYSPAQFIETVNTVGKPMYAKQERMKWDEGIEVHTQSNPLMLCARPGVLIKGQSGGSASS